MTGERREPAEASDLGQSAGWDVPWTWADAALAFLTGILLAELVRALAGVALPTTLQQALGPALGSLSVLVAVVVWLQLRHPGTVPRLLGPGPFRSAGLLAGAGHGLAAFAVLNLGFAALFTLLAELVGAELPPVQESIREVVTDPDVALAGIVYAVAIAALVEEVLFRGLLFQALRRPLGRWPAIGLSGVVFGLAHYQPDNLLGWMYTFTVMFPFGMYMAWAFDRHRHLAVPLVMHVVFNAVALAAILRGWG